MIYSGTERSTGAEDVNLTTKNYPIIDGSTFLIPFSEAITGAVLNLPPEEARLYVKHNRTDMAYVYLVDKKSDIIFVTPPSRDELKYAEDNGVELELYPLIKDGFVFFVNSNNPVDDLSASSIVGIYSGEITNWKELGGLDAKIKPFQRPVNSGSQTAMLDLVMKNKDLMEPPEPNMRYGIMSEIVSSVASFDNGADAIGYSYYYYTQNMWSEDEINYLKIDGVAPDNASITDGSYPFVATMYIVLRKDEPADSPARKLANWILSDEGVKVTKEAGYVPY
jgi:phosphate transport system substrate-binding protein